MTDLQHILLWLFCAAAGFVLLLVIALRFRDFSKELRYVNQEIARSTGQEQLCWIRRRKKLFLSLLPFVKY